MPNIGAITASLQLDTSGYKQAITGAQKQTAAAGQQAVKSGKGFSSMGAQLGKLSGIGQTMTKTLTPALLGIGAAVLGAANSVDEAFATIQTGTGATGKALDGLKQDFKEVYGSVPADSQAVASAIAEVNTRLGLTGPALQEAARTALEMADAMGVDATAAITSTTQSMKIFGVGADQVSGTMDKMFVVAQTTGIGIDALGKQLQTYGPVLKNAGFSMDEATVIFGQLNAAGVDASRVFPALNAFFRKTALAGGDLREEFGGVAERIANATTETDALSIATEAFGAEGAQRMVVAIRDGSFELDALTIAMDESQGAIAKNAEETRTATEQFAMLRREIGEKLGGAFLALPGPLQAAAAGFIGVLGAAGPFLTVLPGLATAMSALGKATIFKTGATVLATIAQAALNAVMAINPYVLIAIAIAALITGIVLLIKNWDTVKAKTIEVFAAIQETVLKVVKNIVDVINKFLGLFGKEIDTSGLDKALADIEADARGMAEGADEAAESLPRIWARRQRKLPDSCSPPTKPSRMRPKPRLLWRRHYPRPTHY